MKMQKALTLLELIITTVMFVILAVTVFWVFRTVLLGWSSQETRSGVDISLDRGIEEIVRDLREARRIQSSSDEVRFTQDSSTYYIYYFYNAADTYPLAFNQGTYKLMKATLSGGVSGTFTFGSGQIIINDLLPPPTSDLSISSNLVTIDLSITRRDETIRSKTQVKPRNL